MWLCFCSCCRHGDEATCDVNSFVKLCDWLLVKCTLGVSRLRPPIMHLSVVGGASQIKEKISKNYILIKRNVCNFLSVWDRGEESLLLPLSDWWSETWRRSEVRGQRSGNRKTSWKNPWKLIWAQRWAAGSWLVERKESLLKRGGAKHHRCCQSMATSVWLASWAWPMTSATPCWRHRRSIFL